MTEQTGQQERPKVWRMRARVFSRVVGYYAPLDNWHDAKKLEFEQRRVYDVPGTERLETMGAKEGRDA